MVVNGWTWLYNVSMDLENEVLYDKPLEIVVHMDVHGCTQVYRGVQVVHFLGLWCTHKNKADWGKKLFKKSIFKIFGIAPPPYDTR